MKKSSVIGCAAFALLLLLVLVALLFLAPGIAAAYARMRGLADEVRRVMLAAFYVCAVPEALALGCLLRLLDNIRREQMFSRPNSRLMGCVSWCCVAVGAVCGGASFWYLPLLLVTAAMLFLFLIVRVVRGCFLAGTAIKEENSLTI